MTRSGSDPLQPVHCPVAAPRGSGGDGHAGGPQAWWAQPVKACRGRLGGAQTPEAVHGLKIRLGADAEPAIVE